MKFEFNGLYRPLTDAERKHPLARYYEREMADPDPEAYEIWKQGRPMDYRDAMPIGDMNAILDEGYQKVETGCCVLPNGAAYMCNRTFVPNGTADMFSWWYPWKAMADFHYRLWYPPCHYTIRIPDDAIERIKDPTVPLEQKSRYYAHDLTEDVGGGNARILLHYTSPYHFGFDLGRFRQPYIGNAMCINIEIYPLDLPNGSPPDRAVMLHTCRDLPGGKGIELRSRCWMGYSIVDRRPVLMLREGQSIAWEAIHGFHEHVIIEYSNLASFLPEIYDEMKGQFVVP
ncbi:MAG: hypothetical protein LBS32_05050 [Clostridiales Family XIII bacterium]|jgi:hypothetical protein|nr:hypothetical protein [Clostridiales Family XIII bacterium]